MEKDKKKNITNIGNGTLRFANEGTKIIKAHNLVPTKYAFRPANGKSNVLKIVDTTAGSKEKWVLRIDKGHAKGAKTPHINLNEKLTGLPDPHTKVSNGALKAAECVNTVSNKIQSLNKILLPVAIAIDTARIGHAVYTDYKKDDLKIRPKKTIKTTSSVAGGWSGGLLGGWGGGQVGSAAGGAIGSLFGGIGAVPGAAVGCILGSITGAITGGIGGSFAAEKAAQKICDNVFDKSERKLLLNYENIIIYIATAENIENLNFFVIDRTSAQLIDDFSFEISDISLFLSELPNCFKKKTKAVIFNLTHFVNSKYPDTQKFCQESMKGFPQETLYKIIENNILFVTTALIAANSNNNFNMENGTTILLANIFDESSEFIFLEYINEVYQIKDIKSSDSNDPVFIQLNMFSFCETDILVTLTHESSSKCTEIVNLINETNFCQSFHLNSDYKNFLCNALIEVSKMPKNCKFPVIHGT